MDGICNDVVKIKEAESKLSLNGKRLPRKIPKTAFTEIKWRFVFYCCCCCCCCLRSVTALFPRGRLPKEDLRRSPLPPRPLVTPGPCCSSCSLSPHTYCHASCIRSVPSPVLLSYTDILPSIWSAPSLSSCPTHIFKTPHI